MKQKIYKNKENRIKKRDRMAAKNDSSLINFYRMVAREPIEQGKKQYTKLVDYVTAAKLINRQPAFTGTNLASTQQLSRTFKEIQFK
jgi:cupin superfamily acireductone dioxygenase involved in methionine salvage